MRAFQGGGALCGALALALACAPGAQAQTYNITNVGWTSNPGWVIGPVHYPALSGGMEEARLGPSVLKGSDGAGNAVSLTTWCIDLLDPLQPDSFTATDIAHSGFDVVRLGKIQTFLEHAGPLAVDPTSAAAVQLGIWEILYEDADNGWNANAGNLYLAHLPAVNALANIWLTALADGEWQAQAGLSLQVLVPQGVSQAQVRLVAAPQSVGAVPEPATWAMMVAGFGLAAAGMRRRRTQIAFS